MLHLIDFRRIVLAAHYAKEGKTEAARELYAPAYRRLAAGSPLRRIILPCSTTSPAKASAEPPASQNA